MPYNNRLKTQSINNVNKASIANPVLLLYPSVAVDQIEAIKYEKDKNILIN